MYRKNRKSTLNKNKNCKPLFYNVKEVKEECSKNAFNEDSLLQASLFNESIPCLTQSTPCKEYQKDTNTRRRQYQTELCNNFESSSCNRESKSNNHQLKFKEKQQCDDQHCISYKKHQTSLDKYHEKQITNSEIEQQNQNSYTPSSKVIRSVKRKSTARKSLGCTRNNNYNSSSSKRLKTQTFHELDDSPSISSFNAGDSILVETVDYFAAYNCTDIMLGKTIDLESSINTNNSTKKKLNDGSQNSIKNNISTNSNSSGENNVTNNDDNVKINANNNNSGKKNVNNGNSIFNNDTSIYTKRENDTIDEHMSMLEYLLDDRIISPNVDENSSINLYMTKDDEFLARLNFTELSKTILSSTPSAGTKTELKYDVNTFYGLPLKVKDILQQNRGIKKLYDWQDECLCLPAIMKRKNMVYSLPTSGGKTLVAEILIMQEILLKFRNVILVLPYVSIVQEKVRDLSPFAVQMGFHIEEYAARKGVIPPKKRRGKKSCYIATIEKANAIINSLIENERIDELGKIVVDELHMIGEGGGRGALLEILLSKVMFSFKHVQIVGMSATLGNMDELKSFLNAEIFTNEFRPIELTEYVKIDDTLFLIDSNAKGNEELCKPVRKIYHPVGFTDAHKSLDVDYIVSMVLEVIPKNSCLVFCATKKNCENVASMLSKSVPKSLLTVKVKEKQALLQDIKNVSNGICKVLSRTIPCGIAYHHSGLTMDERKLVEEAYMNGVLCLLCCTSTLAAGVNLPAKRVILRSPYVGNKFMSRAQYKQMIGRAGRAGIDTSGESILILPKKDRKKANDLIQGAVGNCTSSLNYDNGKGLREMTLSLLGLKICSSEESLQEFISGTLYNKQFGDEKLFEKIKKEVHNLTKIDMLRIVKQTKKKQQCGEQDSDLTNEKEEGLIIETTDLGKATLKGCMDIDLAPIIAKELRKSLVRGVVLATDLHLLYLATPLEQINSLNVNWMMYYNQVSKFKEADARTVEILGVKESALIRKATGQVCSKFDDFVYKRFYLSLMLYHVVKKKTIWEVSDMFEISRGFLQNLLSSYTSFASLLVYFTSEIADFLPYKLLFQNLVGKLTNTSNMELTALMEIPGVKQARARQLFKAGYHAIKDLARADVGTLCKEIEYLPRKQANLIVSSAKMLLQEQIEALREEADEIAGIQQ